VLLRILKDGRIDLSCLEEQVDAYAAAGVDGVYTNGTATEFHGQSDDAFADISTRVAQRCREHGLPFQLGATHPLPMATLDRIRLIRSLSPGAIQVVLPDWVPVDLETASRFLSRCAVVAGDVGLVLYNPPHAKTVLTPTDFIALADAVPGLVGIKCGGGDAAWYEAMRPVLESLSVFIPGHFMATGSSRGAHGSYSNMACLNPRATVAWNRQIKERPDDAMALERRIGRFMEKAISPILDSGYPGYACDKLMASVGGWADISPRLLWPHAGIPDRHKAEVRRWAEKLIPEFVEPTGTATTETPHAEH